MYYGSNSFDTLDGALVLSLWRLLTMYNVQIIIITYYRLYSLGLTGEKKINTMTTLITNNLSTIEYPRYFIVFTIVLINIAS